MPKEYVIRPEGEGLLVEFATGVRIRLIAIRDVETGRYKVRLPYGVTIAPHHWRRIAPRAAWLASHHPVGTEEETTEREG